MKNLTKLIILVFALLVNIFDLQGQIVKTSGASLPVPMFQLSDTGENAERLKQIGEALKKKEIKTYTSLMGDCVAWLYQHENSRFSSTSEISKSELATREWFAYYVCLMPFPTVEEIREYRGGERISKIYTILDWLNRSEKTAVRRLNLNKNLFYKNHALYIASLLKELKDEEELLAKEQLGVDVRKTAHFNEGTKRSLNYYIQGDTDHSDFEKNQKKNRPDLKKLLQQEMFLSRTHNTLQGRIKVYEKSFFRFLTYNFMDTPAEIPAYLRLAGYNNDEKIAGFYVRANREMDNERAGMLFGEYVRKKGYSLKKFEALAEAEKKTNERRIESYKKYWATEQIKVEAEAKKLSAALQEAEKSYRKKLLEENLKSENTSPQNPATDSRAQ